MKKGSKQKYLNLHNIFIKNTYIFNKCNDVCHIEDDYDDATNRERK